MKQIESSVVEEAPVRRSSHIVNGGFFLLVIALSLTVYFTPLKTWLAQGELIKSELAWFGFAAPLVFIAATIVLTVIGVPRLLLCSLAGMTFGFSLGLLWNLIGTLLGSYLIFLFIRWRGQAYTLQHFPKLKKFSNKMQGNGLVSVFLLRQLPMSGFYNTVFLGLAPISHRDFLLGSLLGFSPLGVTACLIGAGLIQADFAKGVQYVILALVCSMGLGFLLNRRAVG